MEPVKALLFDVFGTVVDWRSGVIRDVTVLAAEYGADIDAASFAALSGAPVLTDVFERDPLRGAFPYRLPYTPASVTTSSTSTPTATARPSARPPCATRMAS